jgi:hypothetical protein
MARKKDEILDEVEFILEEHQDLEERQILEDDRIEEPNITECEEISQPNKTIKVVSKSALSRPLPKSNVRAIGKVAFGKEFDVVEIVKGQEVLGSDKWYKIHTGFIHSSYVVEI